MTVAVVAFPAGCTSAVNAPEAKAGTVTFTPSPARLTIEPGMSRTTWPFFTPALCPDPLTTTASRAELRSKLTVAVFAATGWAGPALVIVVVMPGPTAVEVAPALPLPVARTTPSVVVMVVVWSAETRTWNAVPCTVAEAVGVITA